MFVFAILRRFHLPSGVETRRIFIVDVHGQVTVDPERVSPVKLQNYGDIKMKIDEYFPVPTQLQRTSGSC